MPITSRRHLQGGVPEGVAKLFGRLLLAFVNLSAVDHHIMLVRDAVNADRVQKNASTRTRTSAGYYDMNRKEGNHE
ncbi:MAG: hypothetical protein WCB12_22960 [Bryobacteraceae bacterium]